MKQINIIALITAMSSVGCGTTADTGLSDAWQLFQLGDYAGAHAGFAAIDNSQEALAGLGWTTLRMDSLPQADRYFSLGDAMASPGDSIVEGYAGWAVTGWWKASITLNSGDWNASINRANTVLRLLPDGFEFLYDGRVTQRTLWLIQSYGYFNTGDLSHCRERILLLDPLYSGGTDVVLLLNEMKALSKTEVDLPLQ